MDQLTRARDAARSLKDRAGDASSKTRAASHANVEFKRGDTSFSAAAGADAGASAEAEAERPEELANRPT